MSFYNSVYQAELVAIDEGTAEAIKPRYQGSDIVNVFSDSESALKALNDKDNTHPIIADIHSRIIDSGKTFYFYKVKSHCGIRGNEEADRLANEAADQATAPIYDSFPTSFIKEEIRGRIMESWDEEYKNSEFGRTIKKYFRNVYDGIKWFDNVKPEYYITQFLCGHGFHKSYLYERKLVDDDCCPCDNLTPQTINHIFEDCPAFYNIRSSLEGLLRSSRLKWNDLNEIAKDNELRDCFLDTVRKVFDKLKVFNNQ